ncbi:DNA helicase RecQ [Dawidia soli]|uniref:DNA helicase RecQ n=1 Tax=Dawidia soli TaxID=2782352 RepID=A0AAP2DAD4_9BACT|nr:DNA helicase RecQ [Dawidia soli]MBT1686970.1 DNA helicase RecQ [Dawidia soli]
MNPLEILQKHFGYSSFRLEQEAIVRAVLAQRDTLVLMPTGGGKSLCYQVPALCFPGLTVVISPLIALMKNQVDALRLNGVHAAFLNSTQTPSEQSAVVDAARAGTLKLLYLAPESTFLKELPRYAVSLLAIDEAHCISHWGHDFRPEYLNLAQLRTLLPKVPVIALTATADRQTRKDIVDKLSLQNPAMFVSSFNRANIRYTVESKQQSGEKLLQFLRSRGDDSGVIYCMSRNSTEEIAAFLTRAGFEALPYHAGLDRTVRSRHQDQFLRDEVKIIVATIAFGMGIDKSNVRYVVHMDLPKSIEGYYQETGRAGRDGLDSEALLFYSYGDVTKLKRLAHVPDNEAQTEIAYNKLDQMAAYGDLRSCRRRYLLQYFDEPAPAHCGNCDVCLAEHEQIDATILSQKVLSAVSRLQGRFGAGYVIDFLRGSQATRIQEFHKKLPTYGIGADVSKNDWHDVIRELIAQGYLAKADGQYPLLQLTDRSDDVLRRATTVLWRRPLARAVEHEPATVEEAAPAYDTSLFQQLKDLRRRLAAADNVPAYIVLSDATLQELASYLPHGREEFSRISGFGQQKLERYADAFGEIITNYCARQGLTSRIHLKTRKRSQKTSNERDNDTKQQTLDLFNKGYAIEAIAAARELSPVTIENHLAFYVQQGRVPLESLVEKAKLPAIRAAIKQSGGLMLTPIKDILGDAYSYREIRMTVAALNARGQ